jgi:hypothetical protein
MSASSEQDPRLRRLAWGPCGSVAELVRVETNIGDEVDAGPERTGMPMSAPESLA